MLKIKMVNVLFQMGFQLTSKVAPRSGKPSQSKSVKFDQKKLSNASVVVVSKHLTIFFQSNVTKVL